MELLSSARKSGTNPLKIGSDTDNASGNASRSYLLLKNRRQFSITKSVSTATSYIPSPSYRFEYGSRGALSRLNLLTAPSPSRRGTARAWYGVMDVLVPKPSFQGAGVMTRFGQGKAAAMPEQTSYNHWMGPKYSPRGGSGSSELPRFPFYVAVTSRTPGDRRRLHIEYSWRAAGGCWGATFHLLSRPEEGDLGSKKPSSGPKAGET